MRSDQCAHWRRQAVHSLDRRVRSTRCECESVRDICHNHVCTDTDVRHVISDYIPPRGARTAVHRVGY